MQRSRTLSSDRLTTGALIWAGVASGVAVLATGRAGSDVRVWLPDFAVGAVYVTAGAMVVGRTRAVGVLLLATGCAWFIDTLAGSFEFLHRGPLIHLLLAYPLWRPAGRPRRYLVAVGYVAAALWPLWADAGIAVALAVAVAVLAVSPDGSNRGRRDHWLAGVAAVVFAVVVVVGTLLLATAGAGYRAPVVHVYELALGSIAILLAVGTITRQATIPDLVVDLGESRSAGLRGALALALGDPTLELGFWTVDPERPSGSYVAPGAHRVDLPDGDAGRRATFVDRGTEPLAVLIHDAAILDDASVVEQVAAATRLHDVNRELARDERRRVEELVASRRRLVVAEDRARQQLERRLDAGVGRRLAELEEQMRTVADERGAAAPQLALAVEHLARSREDVEQIAQGLHPRALDRGLRSALEALAATCPLPVRVVSDEGADAFGDVAVAAYFVCAEALANVVKHSGAAEATISVRDEAGSLVVAVRDGGLGGADPQGSGLRGLADRIDALGGRLSVQSGQGGTVVSAVLPVTGPER